MNIIEISKKIEAGGKGKRSIWEEGVYIYQEFGNVYVKTKYDNGKEYDNEYLPFIADLYANDWEIYEEPKPILDTEEKAYLEGVIRPFKDEITHIKKYRCIESKEEYIDIFSGGKYVISLPPFPLGTMYKGMVPHKEYTLEELGLFDRKIY